MASWSILHPFCAVMLNPRVWLSQEIMACLTITITHVSNTEIIILLWFGARIRGNLLLIGPTGKSHHQSTESICSDDIYRTIIRRTMWRGSWLRCQFRSWIVSLTKKKQSAPRDKPQLDHLWRSGVWSFVREMLQVAFWLEKVNYCDKSVGLFSVCVKIIAPCWLTLISHNTHTYNILYRVKNGDNNWNINIFSFEFYMSSLTVCQIEERYYPDLLKKSFMDPLSFYWTRVAQSYTLS